MESGASLGREVLHYMSKRELPATPFRLVGPEGSYTTSSSSPPTQESGVQNMAVQQESSANAAVNPSSQLSAIAPGTASSQPHDSGMQIAAYGREEQSVPVSTMSGQQRTGFVEGGDGQTTLFQQNVVQHLQQQNVVQQLQQNVLQNVQMIDPSQLDQLIDELVRARSQRHAQEAIDIVHQERSQALSVIDAERNQAQAERSRIMEQAEVERSRIMEHAENRFREVQHERNSALQHLQTAQANYEEMARRADAEIQALRQQIQDLKSPASVGIVPFSQRLLEVASEHGGRAPSIASVSPLSIIYCSTCGSQNVKGRESCWKCGYGFTPTFRDNNGADPSAQIVGVPPLPGIQALDRTSSKSFAGNIAPCANVQGLGIGPCPVQAQGGKAASQRAPLSQQGRSGPRIQGGHIVRPSGVPENVAVHNIATPRSNSSVTSDSEESEKAPSVGTSGYPDQEWILDGETEEKIYKIKSLQNITVTKLPMDATSCREWRAAFLASVSRVDLTTRDVLVKYCTFAMDGGRGRSFREKLQEDEVFIPFNKHIAAELIKQDVLATNTDLAHEITSFVEGCAAKEKGPRGAAILNIIAAFYETGLSRSVALDQMHLLGLQLAGRSAKDLTSFVRQVNYILHGLKERDRPAPATLFQWLWQQIKRVPMLSRITDKVRESSATSHRRTFTWLWAQIAEELRERRHDSNYDNLTKGLRDMPQPTLAVPAAAASSQDTSHKKKTKGKSGAIAQSANHEAQSAMPAERDQQKKFPCSLYAKGSCKFGDKCKYQHIGTAGSEEAKKASAEHQQSRESKGKGGKGKGKGKSKDKKNESGSRTAASAPSAAAAAVASTVTISEVDGRRLMQAWRGFCEFAHKALPAMHIFLKLSIPILASLVQSIVESSPHIGMNAAAGMLYPTVEEFRGLSLELLGDTGAAHDIGSFKALEEQGISQEMAKPWLQCLENPVRFATGGGAQVSEEAMRIYADKVGALNLHLLQSCPLAMSIGRQVAKGRTFVWQHGKTPFIALDHKKCRVWCPPEARWYAKRVQHHVPIFEVGNPHRKALAAPVQDEEAETGGLWQPAMCASSSDSNFCGLCMERTTACVCTMPDDSAPFCANAPILEPRLQQRKRQHRKDNRRRRWEKQKKLKQAIKSKTIVLDRGASALSKIMKDMSDFFESQLPEADAKIANKVKQLLIDINIEHEKFLVGNISIATLEPHHGGLPGHGHMIECCTRENSAIGTLAEEYGITVYRMTESKDNLMEPGTVEKFEGIIDSLPGVDLWGSLPCGPWSSWQSMCVFLYGENYVQRLNAARKTSREMIKRFHRLALRTVNRGGRIAFEWPRHALGWHEPEMKAMISELDLVLVDFDGCSFNVTDKGGNLLLKRWRLACSDARMARLFQARRCSGDHQHGTIEGSHTKPTGYYPTEMVEEIFRAWYPQEYFRHIPAMPVVADEACSSSSPMALPAHREKENGKEEKLHLVPLIFETVDSFFGAALEDDGGELADSEDDTHEPRESRDVRLKREAKSIEHLTLHDRKNPFCEHCLRGRMLKRYARSHREEAEEAEKAYEEPSEFGFLIEADHMFPSDESQAYEGEKTALLILDRFTGLGMVYPSRDRSEESCYNAMKHFGGHRLNGNTNVVFKSDAATELTNAASRLCWTLSPSVARTWPHNARTEREIRSIKETCRPSHLQAGFTKRMWPISVTYTAKARSFWGPCAIRNYEIDTEAEKFKKGKTKWEIATGEPFSGPKYPLGALVFYRAKGDGMSEPTTSPGLFAGWRIDSGLRYRNVVQVLDYEAVRQRSHLHCSVKDIFEKEVYFPPHLSFLSFPWRMQQETLSTA